VCDYIVGINKNKNPDKGIEIKVDRLYGKFKYIKN